ncbi:MAG: hypothetical protein Q4C52_11975 [Eubacteriales bacterium]|nr:hypothetical protein [Eubacteriales bacterium]
MPNFSRATITNKGLELNAKANFGRGTIVFTKAATGSGRYTPDINLMEVTDLIDKRQEVFFVKKEIVDRTTVHMRSIITNDDLAEGYDVTEFGIYAKDPDEGEILYSITTADKPDYLPDKSIGSVAITIESYVSVANSENVMIIANTGAYALEEDVEKIQEQINNLKSECITKEVLEKIILEKLKKIGKVKIGPKDTYLAEGDTLFITDGEIPGQFKAAEYTNIIFSSSAPEHAEYWARMPPAEDSGQTEGTGNVPVTTGEIAVSQEAPADAVFYAKITP